MDRLFEQYREMPKRVGEFLDPFTGRRVSATLEGDVVSISYLDNAGSTPIAVNVSDFNDWYLKILVPTEPMRKDGPIFEE